LTFTALKTGTSDVTVGISTTSLSDKVQALVKSYNDFLGQANALRQGSMGADSLLLSVESQLRRIVFSDYSASNGGTFSRLSDIGVSFTDANRLQFDSSKLSAALEQDPSAVKRLLADDVHGIAAAFTGYVDDFTDADGVLDSRIEGLNSSKRTLERRIENTEFRLVRTEERLRAQFAAMDSLVARYQATSDYLTQQLFSLSGSSGSAR
jgi:flagellar hook-associated protein 2